MPKSGHLTGGGQPRLVIVGNTIIDKAGTGTAGGSDGRAFTAAGKGPDYSTRGSGSGHDFNGVSFGPSAPPALGIGVILLLRFSAARRELNLRGRFLPDINRSHAAGIVSVIRINGLRERVDSGGLETGRALIAGYVRSGGQGCGIAIPHPAHGCQSAYRDESANDGKVSGLG